MLKRDDAVLIFIDVQGRLAEIVDRSEVLFKNLAGLLQGMTALEVPVVVTEQIPEKLGGTHDEFQEFITEPPIAKSAFSCCGEPAFIEKLKASGRRQVILCGIETHICVYQTAAELLVAGYEVHVVVDAVSSRCPDNKKLALKRMASDGVKLTGTEMLLFELLGSASAPEFKSILQIVK